MAFPNGLGSCLLCGTCSQDQDEAAECTATSNTRCQCRPGRFYKAPGDEEFCTGCSTCPEGTVVLQQCNSTADTVCGPPGPEGRHRLWLVGSFMILSAVLLGITMVTACTKKPKVGRFQPVCSRPSSSARSELEPPEERPRDRGESLAPESSVCCGSSHGTREADPPGPHRGPKPVCVQPRPWLSTGVAPSLGPAGSENRPLETGVSAHLARGPAPSPTPAEVHRGAPHRAHPPRSREKRAIARIPDPHPRRRIPGIDSNRRPGRRSCPTHSCAPLHAPPCPSAYPR
ncbi:tumor necrosis factor receptor superfamily member 10A-like [Phyllostomus hastatus]|uniref:tumor necrosis factor receptor superfamily member 10A-like n=1 Tax=Phyllostomus hastatus TaxID=9423 RepID=UPI001E6806F4|nr:tumor necrosis factor receptor superfamily member 10A-like [Phyllostomus hastatus]